MNTTAVIIIGSFGIIMILLAIITSIRSNKKRKQRVKEAEEKRIKPEVGYSYLTKISDGTVDRLDFLSVTERGVRCQWDSIKKESLWYGHERFVNEEEHKSINNPFKNYFCLIEDLGETSSLPNKSI